MDFVGGLPMTKRDHEYLFVVVDIFNKMCVFIPCKKTIIGQDAANLFFSHVWVHCGLPNSIISDRDSRFLGKFWICLCEKMDTRLKRSTSFHPQMAGKIEVMNKIVVQLLRGCCGKHTKSWDEHLEYIQYSYNKAIYSSINKSPFETCLGYLPPSPFDCVFGQQKDEED